MTGGALWGGRFEGGLSPEMRALSRSTHFDVALVAHDCRVLAAHAGALRTAGVLTAEEAAAIRDALPGIAADIAAGTFGIDEADEDIHSVVERALAERVPDAAGKSRSGLSRNDRVATAFRLWIVDAGKRVSLLLDRLVGTLEERAIEHRDTIMPGYTHLQRAQPVTLAANLSAHAAAFRRDHDRITAALERAAVSPLGAGALAGSLLGLDRNAAAEELGLRAPIGNTLDAVASRDFALELLAVCAILGVHLSRLGEEIVLWTSSEFGFAVLDDAYATGSSLMPHKKNPDVAELARGKAGRLIGHLTGLLATVKSLPLSYNRDLQEDKEPVFDAIATLELVLPALAGAVATMRFDTTRLAEAATDPLLLATDLAEHLVARGVTFKDAHEIVGRAVRRSVDEGRSWREWSGQDWTAVHPALADAGSLLDPAASVAKRSGSKAP
ncbi:MAG TPA: argininosuccinate lyase [Actinomycetota bacterium]|nr:argininosuccinate lyase [Actinomycetota bacterium]